MEITFEKQYFDEESVFNQEFRVESRGVVWRGRVKANELISISPERIRSLIVSSIADASRGHEYTRIGKVSEKYKYEVSLRRNKKLAFGNTSDINIKIFDNDGLLKISIDIVPKDYI
jgi:hypothetical protein